MLIVPVLFLLLILFQLYILIFAFSHTGREKVVFAASLLMLLSFLFLYALEVEIPKGAERFPILSLLKSLQKLPGSAYAVLLSGGFVLSFFLFRRELNYQKSAITRTSIKESIDNLPMGLSFSSKRGLVLLSNREMNLLCHKISGGELQDAESFWQSVRTSAKTIHSFSGQTNSSAIVETDEGRTLLFTRQSITINKEEGVQITSIDISELEQLRSKLKQKNADLKKLNLRLARYAKSLNAIKSREERLATKHRLHRDFGSLLLGTRKILLSEGCCEEGRSILSLWKQNISIILSGSGSEEIDEIEKLLRSAAEIGVHLEIIGEVPKSGTLKDLLFTAAIEAINNAVRHADATRLRLRLTESEEKYRMELTNDGKKPKELREGGGLSTLRSKVEEMAGTMDIETEPEFKLRIDVPKRREAASYDKGIDR